MEATKTRPLPSHRYGRSRRPNDLGSPREIRLITLLDSYERANRMISIIIVIAVP